ncbi:MAG: transglutaminase family protein [Puniceicoccales bacterium]
MNPSSAIQDLADTVEKQLRARRVVLTMGGEPTYIPHEPTGAEWNLEAMGPEKLGYAHKMASNLLDQECPGAVVLQIFGKWYPGEPLPRWNVILLDNPGDVLWPNRETLLLEDREGRNQARDATRLAKKISEKLGLAEFLIPARNPSAPKRNTCGWVLPLDFVDDEWVSDQWPWSKENPIPLFDGDSPIGLRLPLGSLPENALQRALTLESINGAVNLFIPPLEWAGFRKLIALFSETVRECKLTDIVLCGYGPSGAPETVRMFGLAADPGVLEINLPACPDWFSFRHNLLAADKAARKAGLSTTRLQLNGNVNGTGGGSHLALGGTSIETNPFLEHPNRISSILRYWQHHPVLSYAFSGQYVGPGCQAPRFDEGPTHSLYETEVACEGMESIQGSFDPIWIDQFLHNLMTDASGNTHRAELCFDKFYNPAAPNGRTGIIEFRAFETLPDTDLMATVALLVRTIVARLIKRPFGKRLRRFGKRLHDSYFLPSCLWEDLQSVCEDLQQAGFPFDPKWLRPVFDFRFPIRGELQIPGGALLVRQALESYPLMAEESQGLATVRKVDNSTDRLELILPTPEVLQQGYLLVNGIEVPFTPNSSGLVCGLRYKCASAHPALHPNVPIQSPLLFEWVDRESGKVTHAARYHHWHPFKPIYDGFPKTEKKAEQRRKERWIPAPEREGLIGQGKPPRTSPEYKVTVDLRRQQL